MLIAHEVFYHLKNRRVNGKIEFAMKLYMQKVYDQVKWGFLLKILEKRGFRANSIEWMRQFITQTSYQVLTNWRRTNTIRPTREMRQGDPI